MATSADSLSEAQLLDVKGLKVHFPVKEGVFSRAKKFCKAVDGVDLRIGPGETYGLVGESGCGKSTLGKAICRLLKPTQGEIRFVGQESWEVIPTDHEPSPCHLVCGVFF